MASHLVIYLYLTVRRNISILLTKKDSEVLKEDWNNVGQNNIFLFYIAFSVGKGANFPLFIRRIHNSSLALNEAMSSDASTRIFIFYCVELLNWV